MGRWCSQLTIGPRLVDDHRRQRRRAARVVLIDPHYRALLVEVRNPDNGELTWMTVGGGIEEERIPPTPPRGKCSKRPAIMDCG